METKYGKTGSLIGISALASVALSFWITPFSSAEEGIFSVPSLGGSNFGQILPKGPFQDYKLDSQNPEPAPSDPVSIYEKEAPPYAESLRDQLNRPASNDAAAAPASITPLSKTNAWYKFLDPSLNLTRTLEESERKNILPIVPMPPSISKNGKGSEYVHTVILKANAKPEYGAFKTGFGSLFGRSASIIMVSSTAKVTRIFNVNGYERDVLFKLPNGQIIAIGPGSEMMISRNLNANELNANDGIARRGFTRTMKCAELNMAFAQFSLPSLLEVAEFRFFQKNQDAKVTDGLQKTAAALDSMRGTDGFHKVLSQQEQLVKRQKAKEILEPRTPTTNRLGSAGVLAQSKPTSAGSAASSPAASSPAASSPAVARQKQLTTAERNAQELKAAAAEKLAAERKLAEKKSAAAKIAAEKKSATEKIASSDKAKSQKSEKLKLAEKESKPAQGEKQEKTALLSRFSLKSKEKSKVATLVSKLRPAEAEEPSIVPANLPADMRELLLLAERNEKQARELRVKAAKNKDFSEAYYLSAEQRLHLYVTFKKQMKKATELDQIAREARDKAAIAGNTNHSTQ